MSLRTHNRPIFTTTDMKSVNAIQIISKQNDLSLAVVFFFYFARFEYALKRAGFVAAGENMDAKPDWKKFAEMHSTLVDTNREPKFAEAVEYFKTSPPKKQQVNNDNQLVFVEDHYRNQFDLPRLLVLVCRVRNNLFHGGKLQSGAFIEINRDTKLLNLSIAVLEACLRAESSLHDGFMDGLVKCE